MVNLSANRFKNYRIFKPGRLVAWDNKNVRVFSLLESKIILAFLSGRFVARNVEALRAVKTLIDEGYLVQKERDVLEQVKVKVKPKTKDNSWHLLARKTRFRNWEALARKIQLALKTASRLDVVFTDSFLQPNLGAFLRNRKVKRFILVNPFSSSLVVSPMFSTLKEFEHFQKTVSHTWTSEIWFNFGQTKWTAEIDRKLIDAFEKKIAKYFRKIPRGHLKKNIFSFEKIIGFAKHEITIELGNPPEKLSGKELKFQLSRRFKIKDFNGGFRTKPLSENIRILQKLNDPIAGFADVVDNIDANGIHIFHSYSYLLHLMDKRFIALRSMGKGSSRSSSYVSCLAELVERALSMGFPKIENSLATADLKNRKRVDPLELRFYSKSQIQNRKAEEKNPFKRIPHNIKEQNLRWIPSICLSTQETVWVPQEYCYHLDGQRSRYYIPTSNGVATGRGYSEATLQGLYELIERDSAAIWWYNQCIRHQFDVDTVRIPIVQRVNQYFALRKMKLRLIDITSDVAITSIAAVAYKNGEARSLRLGFGCHHSQNVAVARAVTEVMQSDVAINLKHGGQLPDYSRFGGKADLDLSFLNPKNIVPFRPYEHVPKPISFVLDDVIFKLHKLGLDVYLVNFSIVGFPFKVVRVIAPKMRNLLFELAPGRLTEVPKKMNWLRSKKLKTDFNKYCLDL